jgi:hypothetical protein
MNTLAIVGWVVWAYLIYRRRRDFPRPAEQLHAHLKFCEKQRRKAGSDQCD